MVPAPSPDRATAVRELLRSAAAAYPERGWLVEDDDSEPEGHRQG